MKKLKTCVFSAIVLLVISFRDEAESKPAEFPQEREISLKKENDDFMEKFHSGKMSKRSNLDPNPEEKRIEEKSEDTFGGIVREISRRKRCTNLGRYCQLGQDGQPDRLSCCPGLICYRHSSGNDWCVKNLALRPWTRDPGHR